MSLLHTASVHKEVEDSDRAVMNLKVKEPFILHQAKKEVNILTPVQFQGGSQI